MKQRNSGRRWLSRCKALALSALVLWGLCATAGSATASDAGQALLRALPKKILMFSLGDFPLAGELSPAAGVTLSQSALLLSAREELLRSHETETPMDPQLPPVPERQDPVAEQPLSTVPAQDNGVPARTLVPKSPDGYIVSGRSYISSTRKAPLDPAQLATPFAQRLTEEGPQLLIVHTHGSEAYTPADPSQVVWSGDHRSTDSRFGVVAVGDAMADVFSAAGLSVLHDRTLYDYPQYNGSYERSQAAVERHLAEHPSIRFILDVHRDAIADQAGNHFKVVSQLPDGRTASQLTLVVGSDGGGKPHPGWMENLRLATALQEAVLTDCPTLMRPILLRNSRYNQQLSPGSLLLEVGAAGNAPEEARLAAELFAEHMAKVLLNAGM